MTGANRILIGVGWALIAIVYYFKHRRKRSFWTSRKGLEISFLLLATVYSLVIPLKGTLSWVDTDHALRAVYFTRGARRAAKNMMKSWRESRRSLTVCSAITPGDWPSW